MSNVFSVDVEDYFQVEAFTSVVERSSWENYATRVEANTDRVLELLARRGVRGTFFVLGWVASRYPGIVRAIASQGHEIASHGMTHRLIYRQSVDEFRRETIDSKALLEDQCQKPVIGYRAATYSITKQSLWALDVLCDAGFLYDSSIFPVWHDKYGIPDAPRLPHRMKTPNDQEIVEYPITVLQRGGVRIPIAGGGYFRLFPYAFTKWALKSVNRDGQDFVFYMHPWEIDPDQPRIPDASMKSRFRHYLNLRRCEPRLEQLLADFPFCTMRESLGQLGFLKS